MMQRESKMNRISGKAKTTFSKEDGFEITIDWDAQVDRKNTGGWGVGFNQSLAKRLAAAVDAQKAFEVLGIHTDVDGKTYVSWEFKVFGRRMDTDLRRLGF
jgi:hypothetical protein